MYIYIIKMSDFVFTSRMQLYRTYETNEKKKTPFAEPHYQQASAEMMR